MHAAGNLALKSSSRAAAIGLVPWEDLAGARQHSPLRGDLSSRLPM